MYELVITRFSALMFSVITKLPVVTRSHPVISARYRSDGADECVSHITKKPMMTITVMMIMFVVMMMMIMEMILI